MCQDEPRQILQRSAGHTLQLLPSARSLDNLKTSDATRAETALHLAFS